MSYCIWIRTAQRTLSVRVVHLCHPSWPLTHPASTSVIPSPLQGSAHQKLSRSLASPVPESATRCPAATARKTETTCTFNRLIRICHKLCGVGLPATMCDSFESTSTPPSARCGRKLNTVIALKPSVRNQDSKSRNVARHLLNHSTSSRCRSLPCSPREVISSKRFCIHKYRNSRCATFS